MRARDLCCECGDPARSTWKGRRYCAECLAELRDGLIINHDRAKIWNYGRAAPSEQMNKRGEEAGPWQENAIRQMEDRV